MVTLDEVGPSGEPRARRRSSRARRVPRQLIQALSQQPAPAASAEAAGLVYLTDDRPGISRKRRGTQFTYFDPSGRRITDAATLDRIRALAIPPAWTDVWIAPSARAHLQATGRDARGRKQYRYHASWRAHRDDTKYNRLLAFAHALPTVRQQASADLAGPQLTKRKVVAAIVQLLEKTLIRIGNEEYARQNGSFGLTTMRDEHVEIHGSELRFEFTGKSGIAHELTLRDPRLARVVKRCQELPGQALFQYISEEGTRQTVDSADINEYLREVSGADFTAKDFRTWAGTVLATQALCGVKVPSTKAETKRTLVQAVECVARRLGNTKAVCRKCYIHPIVFEAFAESALSSLGDLANDEPGLHARRETAPSLSRIETLVLALLQRHVEKAAAAGQLQFAACQ